MADSSGDKPRVLIIGAGLGGAALAQALRKRDIPHDIFERDPSPTARTQGWAIALQQDFMDELHANTPSYLPNVISTSHLANMSCTSEMRVYNAATMQEILRRGSDHGTPFLRANRGKLRDWLLTDLDVHWGKSFSHYEETAGGVKAHFDDGSSYEGSILVGADGVSSRVRRQFLADSPEKHPTPLPLALVVGELTATREQYERWMSRGRSLFSGGTATGRAAVALKGVADDKESAQYYWLLGWYDEEARTKEDYWTRTASQADLHAAMLAHLDDLHEDFAEVFRATPVEGMLHPPLRMLDLVPPELPRGRVTLLGDAVHPMTPFRGAGGNMAMTDGLRMASVISSLVGQNVNDTAVIADALKAYEKEMTERVTPEVLGSRANAFSNNAVRS